SSRTQTPVPAVWLSVGFACLLALPSLYSTTARGAVRAAGQAKAHRASATSTGTRVITAMAR
ncbi:hypothetical protein, partial [Streptomyces sp. NPDC051098]|uniref:hypothetical protein n=1 Tax=Streptomyces sp. NPDC051098 TaxID=3155411 RepID=UPI00344629D8